MSLPLLVRASAEREIAEITSYYAQYGKAQEYVRALDAALIQIEDRPLMYPVVYADVRRALLRRFPYSVFFVVEPDSTIVLAVHHQRRDPAARPMP